MNQLIIYWGKQIEPTFEWRIRGSNTADSVIPPLASSTLLKADLDAIVPMAQGQQLTVILAAEDIFAGEFAMPQKARRHMRKAAPFMLEEQLAEPVSNLFFAYQPIDKEKVAARVINLNYLEELIQQFKTRGLTPQLMMDELDLLPQPDTGIDAFCIGDKVLVCDENGNRWSCPQEDFSWMLQRFVNQQNDSEALPVAIPLRVYTSGEQIDFIHQLPVAQFAVDELSVDDPLDWLIENGNPTFSLLQGDLAPKKERSEMAQWLSKAAILTGMLLAAYLLYQGSLWVSLNQQKQRLDAEKLAIYKQAFRGQKPNRDPYKSMRSYVKQLGQASGENEFLRLLDSATAQMPTGDVLYPTNISFDGRKAELRLDLFAKSLEILNSYRDALTASGHQVDASSATQNGEGYTSRLTIRRK